MFNVKKVPGNYELSGTFPSTRGISENCLQRPLALQARLLAQEPVTRKKELPRHGLGSFVVFAILSFRSLRLCLDGPRNDVTSNLLQIALHLIWN
jgi:hypothetical protein